MTVDFHDVDWHQYRERGHTGKHPFPTAATAHAAAAKARRRTGEPIGHYRCPWGLPGETVHWHIGHPVSADAMEHLAAAIRHHTHDQETA